MDKQTHEAAVQAILGKEYFDPDQHHCNLEDKYNITFDSIVSDIAIEEAAQDDVWEESLTGQTYLEAKGSEGCLHLAHWKGGVEKEQNITVSNRRMFIGEKYVARQERIAKKERFQGIEFVLNKAGNVRKHLQSTTCDAHVQAYTKFTEKAARARKAMLKIGAPNKRLERRMVALAAREELNSK